jgi:3-oxoacyl-[acyl-carrier protein] reductase
MFDFAGKRVIVTGGSRGIGRAIAQGFVRCGATVSICARDAGALEQTRVALAALGPVHAAVCDMSDAEAITVYVAQAAAAMGGIDVLVNNASGFGRADDEAGWHTAFSVDMMSVVRASHAAEPWLARAAPHGVIVNIGSITSFRPSVKAPAYGAMKAAIKYHTATQAALLAGKNIRVNSVAPGAVTAPGHFWEERKARDDQAYRETVAFIPAGRLGEADEVADVVMFMASPASRWVYGQSIYVDGGQTLFGG